MINSKEDMIKKNESMCENTLEETLHKFLDLIDRSDLDSKIMGCVVIYRTASGRLLLALDRDGPEANFKGIKNWYYEVLLEPTIKALKGK